MKGNRQIGLDGRIFINDCLTDGIFFVYSIILSGILGAIGDVMKLTGKRRKAKKLPKMRNLKTRSLRMKNIPTRSLPTNPRITKSSVLPTQEKRVYAMGLRMSVSES